MGKALVFGATGFLGNNLVRLLNERGLDVVVYRRAGSSVKNLEDCRYEDRLGSLEDREVLARALEGCGLVFNLAACTSLLARDRAERERANVGFARTLVELMCGRGGARLVHCSSVAAVGLSDRPKVMDESTLFNVPHIHYFWTKKKAEEIVREGVSRGVDAVIVNPATVIGLRGIKTLPAETFSRAARGRLLFYPPGGSCFADVRDVARGMLAAAEKGSAGERYILGGANMTFRDYFSRIAARAGARPPRWELPAGLLRPVGTLMEVFLGKMGGDAGRVAAGFGYYSSEKAVRKLGYRMTPIEETIQTIHEGLA